MSLIPSSSDSNSSHAAMIGIVCLVPNRSQLSSSASSATTATTTTTRTTTDHHYDRIDLGRIQHHDIGTQTMNESYPSRESSAQDKLLQQLRQIIDGFTTRSNRRFAYDAKIRWSLDPENELRFSVQIINMLPLPLS